MKSLVRKIFLILGILGVAVGLPYHVATYAGIDPRQYSWWAWFCIQMASGLVAVGIVVSRYLVPEGIPSSGILKWIMIAAGFCWMYAFLNWAFTNTYFSDDALPEMINGQYVLYTHGHIVRHLTLLEYKAQLAYECRYFSGHWMAVFLTAISLFGHSKKVRKEMRRDELPDRCSREEARYRS